MSIDSEHVQIGHTPTAGYTCILLALTFAEGMVQWRHVLSIQNNRVRSTVHEQLHRHLIAPHGSHMESTQSIVILPVGFGPMTEQELQNGRLGAVGCQVQQSSALVVYGHIHEVRRGRQPL